MYTIAPQHIGTHDRIYDYNPRVKLIYMMRDPVERIVSQFAHRFVRKKVTSDTSQVLTDDSYVYRSRYYYQISPYIDKFGVENILLLTFEEFVSSPKLTLVQIARFLGIDADYFENMKDFFPKNESTNRSVLPESGLLRLVSPLKKFNYLLPTGLKNLLLKIFGNKITEKPVFDYELRQQLFNNIREDFDKIEKLLGRELTEWKRYE